MSRVNSLKSGPDEHGRFGQFGGRFVAETLMPLILELEQAYRTAKDDPAFQAEMGDLRTHYAGKVVLVNLWATWCGPCRKEMPSMEAAYQALKDRGFRIAAISLDEGDSEPVRAFAAELGLTFDMLQDRSNNSQQVYQALGVPHSVLIDRDGKVRWVALGAEDWNSPALRERIEALLGDGE